MFCCRHDSTVAVHPRSACHQWQCSYNNSVHEHNDHARLHYDSSHYWLADSAVLQACFGIYRSFTSSTLHRLHCAHVYVWRLDKSLRVSADTATAGASWLPASIYGFLAEWLCGFHTATAGASDTHHCHRDRYPEHRTANHPHEILAAAARCWSVHRGADRHCNVYAAAAVGRCYSHRDTTQVEILCFLYFLLLIT